MLFRKTKTLADELVTRKAILESLKPGASKQINCGGSIPQQLEETNDAIISAIDPGATRNASDQTLRAELAQAIAERDQTRQELKEKAEEIDQLKAEAAKVEDRIHKAASARALEIAQSQGNVPPIAFRVAKVGASGDVLNKINSIKDPMEQAKYIRENKEAISEARERERMTVTPN